MDKWRENERQIEAFKAIKSAIDACSNKKINVTIGSDDLDGINRIYDLKVILGIVLNQVCKGLEIPIPRITKKGDTLMNRVGSISKSNNNLLMTIIAYRSDEDIDICFENGVIVTNQKYDDFVNGNIVCD